MSGSKFKSNNFYENKYPKVNDVVFVRPKTISDDRGMYVELVEYGNIPGLIISTEIARKNINPAKIFNATKVYPCVVLSIDEQKHYIDLSYKKITPDMKVKYEENYAITSKIFSLGKDACELYDKYKFGSDSETEKSEEDKTKTTELVLGNTVWKLFKNTSIREENMRNIDNIVLVHQKLYNNLLENTKILFDYNTDIEQEFVTKFLSHVVTRIKSTDVTVTTEFTLFVLSDNAIEKLKNILTENINGDVVKVEAVSSPKYKIVVTQPTVEKANEVTKNCMDIIRQNSSKYMGKLYWDNTILVQKDKTYAIIPFKQSYIDEF